MHQKTTHTKPSHTSASFPWTSVYFVGIGGIGMSAIARYFVAQGMQVGGYDKTPTKITDALIAAGAQIHFTDAVAIIPQVFLEKATTLVVYTPAIPATHTEFTYFKEKKFTLLKRAEVLGSITKNTFCLAVAGTHGKTTTSSILGHIMQPAKATSFLGGIAENCQSNLILGDNKVTVVEADEFDRSFLQLAPDIACITSMDADHLDIYGAPEALTASFVAFSEKISNTLVVAKGLPLEGVTYAIEETADYSARNVLVKNGSYVFDVQTPTETVKNIHLSLPGKHNVMNALAAFAMAAIYGVPTAAIKKSLGTFKGVQRRFSYKINREDLVLIDDYAHHPTAINAVQNSVEEMYPNETTLAVFQPHLFSRTQDFVTEFAAALSKFDEVLLLDIYPARELPIPGVTSSWLLEKITCKNKLLISKGNLIEKIKNSPAKIKVIMGAGDIGMLVEDIHKSLELTQKRVV